MDIEFEQDDAYSGAVDEKQAKADIAAGARALKKLINTAGHNWSNGWSIAIRGWRGLRELAFKRAGSRDIASQVYRDAMSELLQSAQYTDYRNIPKETRASMTKLVNHIDEIDAWHATLSVWEKERWTNPQTVAKHCPSHLLAGHGRDQASKKTKGKKKKGNPEAEALRATLIRVIIKYVQPVDPDEAKSLLESLYASDPDDSLEGFGDDESFEDDAE